MAHLSEGTLRRMIDDPDAISGSDRAHYVDCTDCQARHSGMADDARAVATMLATPDLKVDVASAFKHVQLAPAAKPRFGFSLPILRPASRTMLAGLGAAAVMITLVVTAFANILPLFQPKTVAPIPITVADVQSLSSLADYGTLTWSVNPSPQLVLSADEAKKVSGLNVPKVAKLPSGVSSNITYAAMPKAVAVFTFDAAKAQAAAAKTGKTLPKLPAGVDGAKLTVTVGPAVIEVFGNLNAKNPDSSNGASSNSNSGPSDINLPQLVVAESAAPLVTSTQVTAKQLENYILSMPGISPSLAASIRAIGDPSSTLLIPVPIQYATSSKVTVQGVPGVALGDNTGAGAGVIWIKNGKVFAVAGFLKQSDVLKIANGLK
ncbi:MAG TPA: hypothetical protein VGT01_04380 [Candidatus Dormibacteraeota bacterium]|nr:hypothetical protein [Candidatus Dormibacteraeota bacterium]